MRSSRTSDNGLFSRVKCAVKNNAKNIGKGALGITGSLAIFLYWDAGKQCAQSSTCGLSVSNVIGATFATKLYQAGGLDYAGFNVVLSFNSIDAYVAYMQEQQSIWAKIGKSIAIGAYAATQCAFIVLLAEGSGSTPFTTFKALCGAVPASIYSSTYTFKYEIPAAISNIHYVWDYMASLINPAETYEESQCNDRKKYYQDQIEAFQVRIQANFARVVKLSDKQQYFSPTDYVFNPTNDETKPQSWFAWGMHKLGMTVGTALACVFASAGIVYAYENVSDNFLIKFLLTPLLTSGGFYVNAKVTSQGVADLFDIVGKGSINSAIWKRSRLTAVLFALMNISFSSFSYAVVNNVLENVFHYPKEAEQRTDLQVGYLDSSRVGMVLYHIISMFHLLNLLMKHFTRDDYLKKLLKIEHELKQFLYMTMEQYAELAENPQLLRTKKFKEGFKNMFMEDLDRDFNEEAFEKLFNDTFKSYDAYLREKGLKVTRENWGEPYRDAKYALQFQGARNRDAEANPDEQRAPLQHSRVN